MITVEKYTKQYAKKLVLKNLSFSVKEKSALGIMGESGCGKTTLLRSICGFDEDYSGAIYINGMKMSKNIPPEKRNISLVMQQATLWPHMTVMENIEYALSPEMKKQTKEQTQSLIENLKIAELLNKYPDQISGGQAKRVSFARAILAPKDILLLDEPFTNIDAKTKTEILQYLKNNYVGKKTIVYVSHELDELKTICDDILQL